VVNFGLALGAFSSAGWSVFFSQARSLAEALDLLKMFLPGARLAVVP